MSGCNAPSGSVRAGKVASIPASAARSAISRSAAGRTLQLGASGLGAAQLIKGRDAAELSAEQIGHAIDGAQLLEEPEVRPGKYIPVFVVEGNSVIVDGKRYVSSLIRGARDSQREYNWEATKEVEMLAMQATSPYLVTPRMVQNHENQWQDAPNKNFFYLKFNPDPEAPGGPQPGR